MAIPNESETLILNLVLKRILTDRDATLELTLYTNSGLNLETVVESDLTEPATGGFARKVLTDATWTVSADEGTYPAQDFVPSGGVFTDVRGAAVISVTAGGTQRIIGIAPFPAAPVTVADGATFRVNLAALVT